MVCRERDVSDKGRACIDDGAAGLHVGKALLRERNHCDDVDVEGLLHAGV